MNTKLTLLMNKETIRKAKAKTKQKGTSLSKLVEQFLNNYLAESEEPDIHPDIKALSGVVKTPVDFDYKELLSRRRLEKFSN